MKPYFCDLCDKSFSTLSSMEKHEKLHKNYDPYKCSICNKTFLQKAKLNFHKKMHENKEKLNRNNSDKIKLKDISESIKDIDSANFKVPAIREIYNVPLGLPVKANYNLPVEPAINKIYTAPLELTIDDKHPELTLNNGHNESIKDIYEDNLKKLNGNVANFDLEDEKFEIEEIKNCKDEKSYYIEEFYEEEQTESELIDVSDPIDIETLMDVNEPKETSFVSNDDNLPLEPTEREVNSYTNKKSNSICKICKKVYSCSGALNLHMRSHKIKKRYECEVCYKVFFYQNQLSNHEKKHKIKKQFPCEYCQKVYKYRSQLILHLNLHKRKHNKKNQKQFVCEYCCKIFKFKNQLFLHLKKSHNNENYVEKHDKQIDNQQSQVNELKKYKCSVCNKLFRRKIAFDNHQRKHYDCSSDEESDQLNKDVATYQKKKNNQTQFECDMCKNIFKSKSYLICHIRTHTGEKPYTCPFCNKSFAHVSSIITHVRVHTGEKPYECTICPKKFAQKSALTSHLHSHEKKVKLKKQPAKCDICKKIFKYNCLLKMHMRSHNNEKKIMKNKENDNNYNQMNEKAFDKLKDTDILKKTTEKEEEKITEKEEEKTTEKEEEKTTEKEEEKTIEKEVVFKCSVCNDLFANQKALSIHKKIHLGKNRYICKICHKLFASPANLKIHTRVHTGEKPYKCDLCNKSFSAQGNLKSHRNTHLTVSYKCKECDKGFKKKSSLENHVKKHDAVKNPYKCNICNKVFKLPEELIKHIESHKVNYVKQTAYFCKICKTEMVFEGCVSIICLKEHLKIHNENFIRDQISDDYYLNFFDIEEKKQIVDEISEENDLHQFLTNNLQVELNYKCVNCDCEFVNEEELINHMKMHDDQLSQSNEYAEDSKSNLVHEILEIDNCNSESDCLNFIEEELVDDPIKMHDDQLTQSNENVEDSKSDIAHQILESYNCASKNDCLNDIQFNDIKIDTKVFLNNMCKYQSYQCNIDSNNSQPSSSNKTIAPSYSSSIERNVPINEITPIEVITIDEDYNSEYIDSDNDSIIEIPIDPPKEMKMNLSDILQQFEKDI